MFACVYWCPNIMPCRLLVSNIMPYRLLVSNIMPYRILVSNIMPYRLLVSTLCRIVYWCPTLCRIVYWCPTLCRIVYWCPTLCSIICFYVFVSVLWYPLRFQHKTVFDSFLAPVLCMRITSYVCYLCLFVSSDIQHVLTKSCMAGVLSIKGRSCLLFIENLHGSPPVFGVCVANYCFY